MNKVLSIISLFSAVWSNILLYILDKPGYLKEGFERFFAIVCSIYIIVLLYNIFTLKYCIKVQKEKQSSKIPTTIAIVGTTLYILIAALLLFLAWLGSLM